MAKGDMQHGVTGFPLLSEASGLMAANKFDQAARLTMEHLRQHPDEPRGLAQLGTIAMRLGALGQAEHFFRLSLRNGASAPEVKRNLASILNQQERLGDARAMFEALLQDGEDPALRVILAVILDKLGQTEEAMAMRERLVREAPDNPFYWIALGHSLRAAGRVDEAVKAYRAATEVDYECGEAWWGLASIKSRVFTDDDVAEMRRAIDIAIDARNSAPAHFALARALHDRGKFAEAFEHYAIGNRQRADSIGYDANELTAEVTEVERTVTAQFIHRCQRKPPAQTCRFSSSAFRVQARPCSNRCWEAILTSNRLASCLIYRRFSGRLSRWRPGGAKSPFRNWLPRWMTGRRTRWVRIICAAQNCTARPTAGILSTNCRTTGATYSSSVVYSRRHGLSTSADRPWIAAFRTSPSPFHRPCLVIRFGRHCPLLCRLHTVDGASFKGGTRHGASHRI